MGRTLFFIAAFIAATANAAYVWQDDDDSRIPSARFPRMTFPTFPTFGQFPFPAFPTIPNFPNFPNFPSFPPLKVPSPEDITNNKDPNFNGIFVGSSSSSTYDKDGKLHKTGGATVVSNNGGVVKEYKVGDDPPSAKTGVKPRSQHPQLPPIIFPQIPIWHPFIPVIPLNPEALRNYRPGQNENFIGSSSSSFSQSSNIDGVKSSSGGTNSITNLNGDVDEKSLQISENEA